MTHLKSRKYHRFMAPSYQAASASRAASFVR
jgi:hypothetical protein